MVIKEVAMLTGLHLMHQSSMAQTPHRPEFSGAPCQTMVAHAIMMQGKSIA